MASGRSGAGPSGERLAGLARRAGQAEPERGRRAGCGEVGRGERKEEKGRAG